ncbi:site-specific DNA-methyltransferase (adenine-specific) [Proteiniborus ethanoligenes]|uniref:site-specific DNA-methyltransferase (adenine-specific) n=1 Tax=Proteiniborus ethanoligenes TaxID=415015 RepID=A0A1H3RY54_9FIRM|nr:Eco57I restriction-modification methylase domain-containing protein [Proteiniborus ethanoligenes]SDZ30560.1 site-specific DNA-methyltransferase (adenine-specific) [Proteiniborus ethanoligenes]
MLNKDLYSNMYNPDVLSTLANLSNDEVFTPPEIANQMLDLLPGDLWSNPEATFLDPACKSGVFLREIAKRLIDGLKDEIPDLQERLDHIFHNQLYGIAITELTSLLSRRSIYGSKYPNSIFSFSTFDNPVGNIKYNIIEHTWEGNRCKYCGASKSEYKRSDELETHAYEFIHRKKPEEIFNMKFDVIIGNPPYQLDTGGYGRQAKPIYHLFVEQAKKLNPRYLSMIIPSRWFAGGMGLDDFRDTMISDNRISHLVDYANAKDCFPFNSISGGVCYFLWSREYSGECTVTNINGSNESTAIRRLDEFPVLVRYNESVDIIHKVLSLDEENIIEYVSSLTPYGLPTNYRGKATRSSDQDLILHTSAGTSYISRDEISKGFDTLDKYKVMVSKTSSEHAGEPGRDGKFRVMTSSMKVLSPGEVCTHSYFVVGNFNNETEANNLLLYLKSRFVRFLILQSMSSINLSKNVFTFVPIQDFSKPWTDEELYKKYGLNQEEIDFIESMIKPME